MRNILAMVALAVALAVTSGIARADVSEFSLDVGASIPQVLDLGYWVQEVPSDAEPYDAGSRDLDAGEPLDFGDLEYSSEYGIFMADKYFTVFMVPVTSSRPYQLSQSCDGFLLDGTGPANLDKSLIFTPDYVDADKLDSDADGDLNDEVEQGALKSGESVDLNPVFAKQSDYTFYTSTTGRSRIVRCYYGIATGDPDALRPEPADAEVVTTDTTGGDYSGTVTFTLVLI